MTVFYYFKEWIQKISSQTTCVCHVGINTERSSPPSPPDKKEIHVSKVCRTDTIRSSRHSYATFLPATFAPLRASSVINPFASAGSERRSTARQIQSKLTEFVCPSSTRSLSAGSERRLTARQIQSKLTEFVCPSSTRSLSAGSERRSTARQIQSKLTEFVCPSSTRSPHSPPALAWLGCLPLFAIHDQKSAGRTTYILLLSIIQLLLILLLHLSSHTKGPNYPSFFGLHVPASRFILHGPL